jgi:hypothetical protein
MDIVCFEQSECSQIAAVGAVRPSIREKNIEAVSQQHFGITGHSEAVVGGSVQQDHSIPVAFARTNAPGAQGYAARCRASILCQYGSILERHFTRHPFIASRKGISPRM